MLRILNERELRAVIAYEVALQRHWSTAVCTLIGAWATALTLLFGLSLVVDAREPGEQHHRASSRSSCWASPARSPH